MISSTIFSAILATVLAGRALPLLMMAPTPEENLEQLADEVRKAWKQKHPANYNSRRWLAGRIPMDRSILGDVLNAEPVSAESIDKLSHYFKTDGNRWRALGGHPQLSVGAGYQRFVLGPAELCQESPRPIPVMLDLATARQMTIPQANETLEALAGYEPIPASESALSLDAAMEVVRQVAEEEGLPDLKAGMLEPMTLEEFREAVRSLAKELKARQPPK